MVKRYGDTKLNTMLRSANILEGKVQYEINKCCNIFECKSAWQQLSYRVRKRIKGT